MKLILISFLILTSGCSLFETAPEQPAKEEQAVIPELVLSEPTIESEQLPEPVGKKLGGLEVMWKVPDRPVELYHLYYGKEVGELQHHLVLPVEKLERGVHPSFGQVYRYTIEGVEDSPDLFVEIRAENQWGLSEPSTPFRAPPTVKRGQLAQ